jgi:hypothetical protein
MEGLDCLGCENPNYVGFDYGSLLKGAGGLLSGFGGGGGGQATTADQVRQQMELEKAKQSASTLKTVLIALGVAAGAGGILYAVMK